MIQQIGRRLMILPLALVIVHFIGFAYSHTAARIQASSNPFRAGFIDERPILPLYSSYLAQIAQGDWGSLGRGRGEVLGSVLEASTATLGLLAITFAVSTILGMVIGLQAVRTRPPGAAPWLIPFSTVGLAMPSFYIGILLISALIFYTLRTFSAPPLPFGGFGWDRHLVLPVLALAIRPTLQLAQMSSRLLGDELRLQHVVAERSLGYTWRRIRWHSALRNVLAPIILAVTGSFRQMLGELVLIEYLFEWPGIGRLLALTLIPPHFSAGGGSFLFLDSRVLPLVLVLFTALFLMADLIATILTRRVDPRLRSEGGGHLG